LAIALAERFKELVPGTVPAAHTLVSWISRFGAAMAQVACTFLPL
jgi:hypothetical protein